MREEIEKAVRSTLDIPALPEAAIRVQAAVEDPNVTARELGNIISSDPTLTAIVLEQANSPFYGFQKKISTIALAVVALGFDTVSEIAISASLVRTGTKAFNPETVNTSKFWAHSLAVAVSARYIARNWRTALPGVAFVSGLLHDIGRLVLAGYWSDEYKQITAIRIEEKISMNDAEFRHLGVSHSTVAAWLAERWRLPEAIQKGVSEHHHDFSKLENDLSRTVWLANVIGHRAGFNHDQHDGVYPLDDSIIRILPEFEEEAVIKSVKEDFYKAESLFNATRH